MLNLKSLFTTEQPVIEALVQDDITSDAIKLFSGERTGHVGHLIYGDSDTLDDHVLGADLWAQARHQDEYYPADEENLLIKKVIARLGSFNTHIRTFIDLGPGNTAALLAKTLPLIQNLHAKNYIAIDLSENYAHNAKNYVGLNGAVKAEAVIANFFTHNLPFKKKNAFLFMGGSTITNIPVDIRTKDPIFHLSMQLSKFRKSVDNNSYLLLGFDANQNAESLYASYGSPVMARLFEDTMWRIARDTPIEFDPSSYAYHGIWKADEHRFAHCVKATRNNIICLPGRMINVPKGHLFHLQNSYKFPVEFLAKAASNAGWKQKMVWTETDRCHYMLLEAV
jgi:uncharacterized SAM-dependent methyltransferase